MIRIALDAMGGDNAPRVEVEGTALALQELPPEFRVQLVGRSADIEVAFGRTPGVDRSRVDIVEAPEVVGMGEKPLAAIRGKPRSSIAVGLTLQKKGRSDAFISAGNTGAVMAASTLLLRLHPGVQRAAIAALLPTAGQPVLVLDVGANVDCDARELLGFAHLGSVYARDVLGRPSPSVGLLNIGEEDEKGNAVVKEAHQLLKQTPGLRYVGNVEGRDIPAGECRGQALDVVACDGFVGNVVLKFYESAARVFVSLMKREAPDVLQRPEMGNVLNVLDYATYGGAPLLGVQGVVIICHGSSPAKAIKNAIHVALQAVKSHLSDDIAAEFAASGGGGGAGLRVKRPFAELSGTGSYAPPRVMTNDEFSKILETSDQWIRERTGIRERRVSSKDESNACMGKAAALQVLEQNNLTPLDVDAIVYATASPDRLLPSAACDLQAILGAKNAAAFDVGAACSGFVYALNVAEGLIASEQGERVLVVAAEKLTSIMDWTDRTTAVLFGDGAGATLVRRSTGPRGILASYMKSDGTLAELLYRPGGGAAHPPSEELLKDHSYYIKMAGREVFKAAVLSMADACDHALQRAGLTAGDLDLLIPHQANIRIIEATAKHAGVPMDKVYVNVDRFGNTSAASIAIALDEAVKTGRLTPGMTVMFVAFGAGFTWASMVVKW